MRRALSILLFWTASYNVAHAELIYDEMQYIEGLRTSCDIKVDFSKGLTANASTVTIVCGNGKSGNCAGNNLDGYFSCRTGSGGSGNPNGVDASINWILNNL